MTSTTFDSNLYRNVIHYLDLAVEEPIRQAGERFARGTDDGAFKALLTLNVAAVAVHRAIHYGATTLIRTLVAEHVPAATTLELEMFDVAVPYDMRNADGDAIWTRQINEADRAQWEALLDFACAQVGRPDILGEVPQDDTIDTGSYVERITVTLSGATWPPSTPFRLLQSDGLASAFRR